MANGLYTKIQPGQIYCHHRFYQNDAGQWNKKYLLVLALLPGNDIVHRLLTSRRHGRPKAPPCFHGLPYPSFYLGFIGGSLTADN